MGAEYADETGREEAERSRHPVTDLSNKTVLFWDASGSYTHIAESVVGDFGRVLVYTPYESGFPIPKNFLPGYGVEGLERVGVGQDIEDFWDGVEIADLVVFTDVGNFGLQEYLRSQNVPVFGSGRGGRLEQDRLYLKSACRKLGLDCADYFSIRGIDQLRQYLMGTDEQEPAGRCFVKLSYFRGVGETFEHDPEDLPNTRSRLREIEEDAYPYTERMDFVVEKPIDDEPCIEVGIDTYCADGLFPDTIMWGYEADKDNCYVGTMGKLPERLAQVATRLSPELNRCGYRGPLSTETRECQKKSYFIDFTARFPEPPSSLQAKMIRNNAEIMYEAAHGRIVEPDYLAKIGVQIVWKSGYGKDHPLALTIGRPERVTIHGHAVIDGQDYAVSPAELEEMGGAVGIANTVEDALMEAIDAVESIKGREVKYDAGALEKIAESIEKGEQLGLSWS